MSAVEGQLTQIFTCGPSKGQGFFVASVPQGSVAAVDGAYRELSSWLRQHNLRVLHERVFGSHDVKRQVLAARSYALAAESSFSFGPVTYISGSRKWRGCFSGVIVHAIDRNRPAFLLRNKEGVPCGKCCHQQGVRWVVLQNLPASTGGNSGHNGERLVELAIEEADRLLAGLHMSYRDVVRTWFYLDDIVAWYSRFNSARSRKYRQHKLSPEADRGVLRLPASTGIGVSGRRVTLNLLAVNPRGSSTTVTQLRSPAQMDAYRYGSAFSRGALIQSGESSLVEMSGTAAIDERGRSLDSNDFGLQLSATLDRVEVLLNSCGGRVDEISAATAFVKRPADVARFWQSLALRGLEQLPVVCLVADICREELLFEIDAELLLTC